MVNDSSRSSSTPDHTAFLAEQLGLATALARDPAGVQAAAARGLRVLPAVPTGPLTEPAPVFDPTVPAARE